MASVRLLTNSDDRQPTRNCLDLYTPDSGAVASPEASSVDAGYEQADGTLEQSPRVRLSARDFGSQIAIHG